MVGERLIKKKDVGFSNSSRLPAEKRLEQADAGSSLLSPNPTLPHMPNFVTDPPPPPLAWRSWRSKAHFLGLTLLFETFSGNPRTPLQNPRPPETPLLAPSFLLSCPWASPAAEAARTSVYNYDPFLGSYTTYSRILLLEKVS